MRTEDSLTTAHTLTEQVEKRGAQSWIDPLIEDMGEWLLLQLGDVANLLEVLLKWVINSSYDTSLPSNPTDSLLS